MCGSSPLPEANTMSAGTGVLVGRLFPLRKAAVLFMDVGLQRAAGRPQVAAAGGDQSRRRGAVKCRRRSTAGN